MPQGRRLWTLRLPGGAAALAGGRLPGGAALALLALETRELRLYRGRSLVAVLQSPDVVTGLCFGRYGREDGTLLMATRGGCGHPWVL
ncbi:Bardet-Biedl syndrome 1 protein, partial [Pezoporus occidentalis]|uniref:Bardet-Biedl syndrome 1 protein n=1 Tax=Pezoporus occidentalis TaxID=407982 RepID=UPI002F90E11A